MNIRHAILLVFLFGLFLPSSQAQENLTGINTRINGFLQSHVQNGQVDYDAVDGDQLSQLLADINALSIEEIDEPARKALLINTYNLTVIDQIMDHYPVHSVMKIDGFFNNNEFNFFGKQYTLTNFEKEMLLSHYKDARLHFVLVCGAISCPPIINEAYTAQNVEQLLDRQTKKSINDPNFIRYADGKLKVSEIFRWYKGDFNDGNVLAFINEYRNEKIPSKTSVGFYPYDWSLNGKKQNDIVYTPYKASRLLKRGQVELKSFNGYYTQKNRSNGSEYDVRATYFSSFNQVLIGSTYDINYGLDVVLKSFLAHDLAENTPLNVFKLANKNEPLLHNADTLKWGGETPIYQNSAYGVAHIGPKIKFNPIPKWSNYLSIQQTLYIPVQKAADGRLISATQLFYDLSIGSNQQLFVEGSLWTSIKPNFQVDPFLKVFYSYFPTSSSTVYVTTTNLEEFGVGLKYFFTPRFEVELLLTQYSRQKLLLEGRNAGTYNIGFRYTNFN